MPNARDNLPNAKHIDRVLAHAAAHFERWGDVALDAAWDAARGDALDAAWNAAWNDARGDAAWNVARDVARDAARDAAWNVARDAARDAAWGLSAWDDCAYILDLPPAVVRTLAGAGNHAAVLLYPAVLAMYEGD